MKESEHGFEGFSCCIFCFKHPDLVSDFVKSIPLTHSDSYSSSKRVWDRITALLQRHESIGCSPCTAHTDAHKHTPTLWLSKVSTSCL